ncbi:MAG: hypothetical protein V4603_16245 [Pseudomonadota bacterium]
MKAVRFVSVFIAVLMSLPATTTVMAQGATVTELGGLRVPPPGSSGVDTNATFAIGLTADNGLSWRNGTTPTEAIRIVGKVRPEASQIGQQADIYLVVKTGAVFLMRKSDGSFVQWSGSMNELVPYRAQTTLTADTEVDLYSGKLGVSGQYQLFIGYRSADGVLRYSPRPFTLNSDANPAGNNSSAPWLFNGTTWQSNVTTPPACPSPLLQAPLDLSKVTAILYPGQTRGGDYKSHGGFRLDGAGQTNAVTVVSSIEGTVVSGVRDTFHGPVQYGFLIINSCGVAIRIGHLLELSPKFAAIADTLPPATPTNTFTTLSGHTVSVGEPIGTAIGLPGNVFMDFGAYDLRSRNPATTHRSGELQPYGICWLDALPAADSVRVRSLPAGDGASGTASDYCR